MSHKKVIVVMPAYNAEKTIEKTYQDIPRGLVDEIIVVDDASRDRTIEIAQRLGLTVIEHHNNVGYGGNQKTCYRHALAHGADIIVMIHPDYQYDARLTYYMVDPIRKGFFDIMLGSRIRTRAEALAGGMPLYKYISNRFLTFIENIVLGQNISDFHTGFRAYHRKVLETIPFESNSDGFVFDSEFLIQAIAFGFRIGEIPVPVRYMPEASSINFTKSTIYGILTLWTLVKYVLFRLHLKEFPLFQPRKTDACNTVK